MDCLKFGQVTPYLVGVLLGDTVSKPLLTCIFGFPFHRHAEAGEQPARIADQVPYRRSPGHGCSGGKGKSAK